MPATPEQTARPHPTTALRVAIVGAGPAGIYAADILSKAGIEVSIDLFERLPAPFGLVRYGVAPDHPRIKQIIVALHKILERGDIRLLANVDYGTDLKLEDLRTFYDAVIFSTGSIRDAALPIPGIDLDGSYGAADFVSWYDGHPDVPRTWPLEAQHVAVLGAGNVALDVARILAKHADDLLPTEIPANVYDQLKASPVTDVHVFARRGPAQVKFSPLELRELGHVPDVDVIVYPEDFEFDDASYAAIHSSNQTKQVVKTLTDWTLKDPDELTASRRLHLHFLHKPVEVLGQDGKAVGLRTERTALTGDGNVTGTGQMHDWPVQGVYRAIGYFGSPLIDIPFDDVAGVIPNREGRVVDGDGELVPGVYATGWIKRGPVGLIGHTKSDASETIKHLVSDVDRLQRAAQPEPRAVTELLVARGIGYVEWSGWRLLDAYEQSLGATQGRERIKVVSREEMIAASRGQA
ncbi:FAD-dependent pyridine nucleotide-disulfide oxidoreductase [Cellulomonas flavigena DSM 20109]|uniref:ferredoxin--NADP(+) reductase n=1 Tax=Cellulomonas flavigena (strain ATCC 482 / DSM 20109 / BCRC 11376 / JCM 18109 / NBRC 3775 / NCIMB 8073 / NRS 134) TaxID=446466 RepID=D5UE75_CELFN|nr:FAD-dependent oxidoreductase [Cellulomonas flavigena]ADG76551.1 FAD-dependent pyridine nucleotide-disulfide oxidoreductase [Cellulomonas flavigena DSM 20109]